MKAVFPGSFDPITLGHKDVILRAAPLFETLYIALGKNTSKQYLIPQGNRFEAIRAVFKDHKNIELIEYNELTVNLCKRLGAKYIVRGLRSSTDFEYERNIAFMNGELAKEIETLFLVTDPKFAGITSTIVREIFKMSGDVSAFVPEEILPFLGDRK
ncbi:MAG: pantetheine-phosphate adenylyltransferase [Bacteroidia bacterium]